MTIKRGLKGASIKLGENRNQIVRKNYDILQNEEETNEKQNRNSFQKSSKF